MANLNKKLVDLLLDPTSTKGDIAKLLVQNDVEISDEDLDAINYDHEDHDDNFDIPYELSEDKKSIVMMPQTKISGREIKKLLVNIPTKEEARFLQDIYYQTQNRRIALEGQLRSLKQDFDSKSDSDENNKESVSFMKWHLETMRTTEDNVKKALEAFSDSYYIAKWAKKIKGIGPVIATVLAANLEIRDGMHAGNWWSYCGLNDNNRPWLGREKSRQIVEDAIKENGGVLDDFAVYSIAAKTKWKIEYLEAKAKDPKKGWKKDDLIKACAFIPYNKSMKVLMYKIGHSFRLISKKPGSLYGRLLLEREKYEFSKNAAGEYAEQAKEILANKNFGKNTVAYSYYIKGELPPTHIHQRAERWVTKLFLSHCFEAAWYNKYGTKCPEPYIIGFGKGHSDYIEPEVSYDAVERDPQ